MEKGRIIRTVVGCLLLAVFVFFILLIGTDKLGLSQRRPALPSTPTPPPTVEPTTAPTPSPSPEPTPEPTPDYPAIDVSSWEFMLANSTHDIGDYVPETVYIENEQKFDVRAADALREFIKAARDQGLSLYLSSAYRDYNTQKYLYDVKVSEYGEEIAKTIVAPPGTSEHQLGLAADMTDKYYRYKDESLEDTELFKWMSANCAQYGFIVRYPKDKTDITGTMYEPWHFRYVGVEAAEYIMERGLCLEEFLELYE